VYSLLMFNGQHALPTEKLPALRAAFDAAQANLDAVRANPAATRDERIAAFWTFKNAQNALGSAQRVGTPRH
jgi:hypothetical protein